MDATGLVCWCGETQLESFSPDYRHCRTCGTLVSRAKLAVTDAAVQDDESDFYGKDYWQGHQVTHLGLPSIQQRARHDLPERCVHWVRHLTQYAPPPGRVLDIGCAHGGFVSLLRHLGYDATGLEVSPWVVDFARQTFQIPVLHGPVEEQQLPEQSFSAVVLNDVVEHLPDPPGTLAHCRKLLKPDGVLVVQMPCFPEGATYDELLSRRDPFLPMMESMAREHLHLFSQRAAEKLVRGLGFEGVEFLPAFFVHDQYLVAGREQLKTQPVDVNNLIRQPSGRVVQALLDLDMRCRTVEAKLATVDADRAARLQVIHRLNTVNRNIEADRAARLVAIQRLTRLLHESDTERAARLKAINRLEDALKKSQHTLVVQKNAVDRITQAYQELAGAHQALLQLLRTPLEPAVQTHRPRTLLRRSLSACKRMIGKMLGFPVPPQNKAA